MLFFNLLLYFILYSGDAPINLTNGQNAPITPTRTTSVLTSRNQTNQSAATPSLTSPLNNSLNNILNYSPPQYLHKNNVTKSSTSIGSTNNNLTASNNLNATSTPPNPSETKSTPSSTNGTSNKIYGSSLLCYQNVPPPSPTNSMINESSKSTSSASNPKTSDENKSTKDSKSSSAITLAALIPGIPGDTTTLPVAVKKRSKLRHRFSDVGSWGLRRKDRAHKYRSMNIESLEVLGDPVIEDEFFVSSSFVFFYEFAFEF